MKIVSWFSCGAASAVATKILLAKAQAKGWEVKVVRIVIAEEHEDNDRFSADCEQWFGVPIVNLKSELYGSCQEVWQKRRYMSGVGGAACTAAMKRDVRKAFTDDWKPDLQAFGYTVEERSRADTFRMNNPEIGLVCPLIVAGLTKADCHGMIAGARIEMAAMYLLGFPNNNCRGCVKDQSPRGWNLTRKHFPEIFEARAKLSRELGVRLVKLGAGDRERIYLDELPPDNFSGEIPDIECSLMCHLAEMDIAK